MEEEYILSGQPVELLLKQLSGPDVTLQDIENFCASSSRIRELCLTNPLFRDLKESKTIVVDISVKFYDKLYSDGEVVEPRRDISIEFYSRIKNLIVINKLIYENHGRTYDSSEKFEYKDLKFRGDILDIVEIIDKGKSHVDEWNFAGYDTNYTKITTPFEAVKILTLDDEGHAYDGRELIIPFELFKSVWSVVRSIADTGEDGDAKVMLNGDVIYE